MNIFAIMFVIGLDFDLYNQPTGDELSLFVGQHDWGGRLLSIESIHIVTMDEMISMKLFVCFDLMY